MNKLINQLMPARSFDHRPVIEREMEARGWTREDLARRMGKTKAFVDILIDVWDAPLPREAAECLAAAFGTSVELWINLSAADKEDE